jgi:MurNAc alpha-1-phosphate uridylyltransferase
MRPLTDRTPKALLEAGGKPLIAWQIEKLAKGGLREIVINVAHLGDKIQVALGDGAGYGVKINYAVETQALETAGGIANALPLLGENTFLVVNCDIYCDFDYAGLTQSDALARDILAHLILVDNPEHHPEGDFVLRDGRIEMTGEKKLTFSGIGLYRSELFSGIRRGTKAPLAPLLIQLARERRVSAEHYRGLWFDAGTPERLQRLDSMLTA